jgi:hypothetical protein
LTSKTISTPRILVVFISIVFFLVPVISTGYGQVYHDKSDIGAKPEISYIVSPAGENAINTDDSRIYSQATYKIEEGTTKYHSSPSLGSGIHWLEVDLRWRVPSNSMALMIYSPSNNILGTYHDNSDGKTDGRIHLSIYPSTGYIEQGKWKFTINGESVSGTQSYTFNLYGH